MRRAIRLGHDWRLEQRHLLSSTITPISRAAPMMTSDSGGGASAWTSPSNVNSSYPPIQANSADGRYTVFLSTAANLITGQVDGNNGTDVFLYDRVNQGITLVSHTVGSPVTAA